jgi:hypothetical protein
MIISGKLISIVGGEVAFLNSKCSHCKNRNKKCIRQINIENNKAIKSED